MNLQFEFTAGGPTDFSAHGLVSDPESSPSSRPNRLRISDPKELTPGVARVELFKADCPRCGPSVDWYVTIGTCVRCQSEYARKRNEDPAVRERTNAKVRASYAAKATPEAWLRRAWKTARTRAREREWGFERHSIDCPTHCPVLGIELDYSCKGFFAENSPSLDRIDSDVGYVHPNVRVISWRANELRRNGTLEEFECIVEDLRRLRAAEPVTNPPRPMPSVHELAQARHDKRQAAGVPCPASCSRCPRAVRLHAAKVQRAERRARGLSENSKARQKLHVAQLEIVHSDTPLVRWP